MIGASRSQNSNSNGQSQSLTSWTPHDIDNSRRAIIATNTDVTILLS